jgi:tRNA1Val (adenine37-N6)-methyltransferase
LARTRFKFTPAPSPRFHSAVVVPRKNKAFLLLSFQPKRGAGYRANVDALHLAAFAGTKKIARAAFDLGAGSGAVGIALLRAEAAAHVTFVEIDDEASHCCAQNLQDNAIEKSSRVIEGDVLDVASKHRGEADLVVCNPPYVPLGAGRAPPEARRAKARQGDLPHFISAARVLLGRRGRVCFVYPAHNLTGILARFRDVGLEPKRLQLVHAKRHAPARIVMIEAQAAKPGGLVVEPPLIET